MSNSSQQCVAIIGGGIAGLVTAVNMLKVGIQPTIFEKTSSIGGLWNPDGAPIWNSLRTNLSKFWTCLPDFSWPSEASIFPTQREVYSYLLNYVQQSIPSDIIRLNTNVTSICRMNDRWIVHYCTKNSEPTSSQYNFVIVTSGRHAHPQIPKDIVGLSSFPGTILHSTDYRSPEQVQNKRVIIVGASVSAAQIAADVALKTDHIIHIAPRKFRPIPRLVPMMPTDSASPFVPYDFNAFRRSHRTSTTEVIFRDVHDYQKLNSSVRLLIGGDQPFSDSWNKDDDDRPPILAISDMYLGWYRAGRIRLHYARLTGVNRNGTLILNNETTIETTPNDVLILCTGYRPCLDFFTPDILEQLSYTSEDSFYPLILYRGLLPLNLPNLAFNGLSGGSFWIDLELQARWLAGIFSGILPKPSIKEQQINIDIEHRIRNQQLRTQIPHPDPVGHADDFAKDLGLIPSNITDTVLATHYRIGEPDLALIAEYNAIVEAAYQGRFVAGVIFRALHGSKWILDRTASNKTRGKAQFDLDEHGQLLYSEENELHPTSAQPLCIKENYMYVYDEDDDSLTVYFVENNNMRGSLFHKIRFQPKKNNRTSWLDRYR